MKTAFIIGNGTSRKGFDLARLKPYGTIFGCNALYRDYPDHSIPDFLVSIDDGIITEIEHSDFPSTRFIVPPVDERWEPVEANPYRPRSNAGINAMREAIKMGYNQLICMGFDFMVMNDNKQSVSNVYDGTANYGMEVRARAEDNPGRIRYLQWLVASNPEVDFIFIFPDTVTSSTLIGKNVFINTYENLLKHT